MKAMKTLLKIFLGLALIGMVGKACDSSKTGLPNDGSGDNPSDADGADIFSNKESTSEEYTLDAASLSSCENYLKGKTFRGGSARLEFGYDGTVSAYDSGGSLVFGGTLELGAKESPVSRWIYVRDMSGGGKLKFLLSADGKMMEPSSLVIYKPS
jgi:hypothetical protein